MDYDAVVIGGGVIGSAIIRYLSLYKTKVLLVKKKKTYPAEQQRPTEALSMPDMTLLQEH